MKGDVMPYGSGPAIRLAMLHAKPWQRYLIVVAMIAGGVALVALGHVAGIVLAAVGCLMIWPMIRYRIRSRKEDGPSVNNESRR
jgi:hypothetical protein